MEIPHPSQVCLNGTYEKEKWKGKYSQKVCVLKLIYYSLFQCKKTTCSFSSGFYSAIIYLKIDIYAFTLEFGPVFCALCGKSFELLIKNVSLGNHRLKAPMTKSIKYVLLSLLNCAEKYFSICNSFILVLNITSNLCLLTNAERTKTDFQVPAEGLELVILLHIFNASW